MTNLKVIEEKKYNPEIHNDETGTLLPGLIVNYSLIPTAWSGKTETAYYPDNKFKGKRYDSVRKLINLINSGENDRKIARILDFSRKQNDLSSEIFDRLDEMFQNA